MNQNRYKGCTLSHCLVPEQRAPLPQRGDIVVGPFPAVWTGVTLAEACGQSASRPASSVQRRFVVDVEEDGALRVGNQAEYVTPSIIKNHPTLYPRHLASYFLFDSRRTPYTLHGGALGQRLHPFDRPVKAVVIRATYRLHYSLAQAVEGIPVRKRGAAPCWAVWCQACRDWSVVATFDEVSGVLDHMFSCHAKT